MRTKMIAGVIASLALVAASCGGDADDGATAETAEVASATTEAAAAPTTEAAPATTEAAAAPTTAIDDQMDGPQRIVSLSPTLTEMMFAIGAGDRLVAVDDFSNYPPAAPELPHELSGFDPNVEAIAAFEPDLVLISGDFTGLGDQLASLDIEVFDGPAANSLDEVYTQIEQLGALTGQIGDAAEVVGQMQTDISSIVDALPPVDEPLTYYHELDPTLFSTTSSTFIGQIYALAGLVNVADAAEADAGPYPQLNAEFLVDANPDLIFLADTKCCGETAETVAQRDGWDSIAAVANGGVIEMDDDIASRWGPRVVDYLQAVVDAVSSLSVPA